VRLTVLTLTVRISPKSCMYCNTGVLLCVMFRRTYQEQHEGRCLLHALSAASHSNELFSVLDAKATPTSIRHDPPLTGGRDPSTWFNVTVLLELLENANSSFGVINYTQGRRTVSGTGAVRKAARRSRYPARIQGVTPLGSEQSPPDFARLIDTGAIIYKGGHFTAIVNMHTSVYNIFPEVLAAKAGMWLLDMNEDFGFDCEQLPFVVDEQIDHAWSNVAKCKPIFRKEEVVDTHRSQMFVECTQARLGKTLAEIFDAATRKAYAKLPNVQGWAPDLADWENDRLFSCAVHVLVRKGHADEYNKTSHQASHHDCPPEGFGPHLNSDGNAAVWEGEVGVDADSFFATGRDPSKLYIYVDGDWKVLFIPPYHVLMFRGQALHAGCDFHHDNAVIHWYAGGLPLREAYAKFGLALFDTSGFDYDTANANGAFPSVPSGKPTLVQSTLEKSLPSHVERAKHLEEAALAEASQQATQAAIAKVSPSKKVASTQAEPSPFSKAKARAEEDVRADAAGKSRHRSSDSLEPPLRRKRDDAFEAMQHQAEAMRKRRQSEDGDVVVGTIVSLQVSEFDRPKLMSPNMTLVVVDVRDSGHGYMLGNEHGFLKTVYTRSQFTVLKSLGPSLLGMGDACGAYARGELSSMIPRELVAKSSPVGKHGIQTRCGCKKGNCNTGQCKCFREGRRCHSGCHGRGCMCMNKDDETGCPFPTHKKSFV
jgi:hypothetical protein